MSRHLPWYRGRWEKQVEPEFQALSDIIDRHSRGGDRMMMAIDFHSGFGFRDHIWIPHAYRKQPIDDIGSYMSLKLLWERNFPHHNYVFGPQAMHYLSHGDMWDYFYLRCRERGCRLGKARVAEEGGQPLVEQDVGRLEVAVDDGALASGHRRKCPIPAKTET